MEVKNAFEYMVYYTHLEHCSVAILDVLGWHAEMHRPVQKPQYKHG